MQDMECRMETMHMGRMIHMLSHQLKRRNIQEELTDEGLTGSQQHIMKFILLRTFIRMCIRRISRKSSVSANQR